MASYDNAGVQVLWQRPRNNNSHLFRFIRQQLRSPDVIRFRTAVAYVTWGGLSLLSKDLEHFLSNGKSFETIFGIENGVTTPDALLYSVHLQRQYSTYRVAKSYRWNYIDSEFHPKYFEFEYADRFVCIVGSGNFTAGGLACNHELSLALAIDRDSPLRRALRGFWSHYERDAKRVTPKLIREIANAGLAGREGRVRVGGPRRRLGLALPRARKPLFRHIEDKARDSGVDQDTLADGDTLTEKPRRLYLQVLKHETGGGHQIQLPVASLGAFFGVGPNETKHVTFAFPQFKDSVDVDLTHFTNATHRVRLRPLQEVSRPAVVVFMRTAVPNRYVCRVVPKPRYATVLKAKCPHQTRKGSRYWGLSG